MSSLAALKAEFSGDIVVPGDADYLDSISRWAANAQRRAAVVAFVQSTSDVALAIKHARENRLHIAIRGGGHSAAGASSSEGGLVIDLSRYLNQVRVDEKESLAYVGGGATWETVDKEAIKYGLATVGGTVNNTGVGGLTLGGGYGWLTGKHGLSIDTLVQATVVTASGSVETASATSNSDLFFGIRGGGSNFGVVTEFVYRLYKQRPTVYSGHLIFTSDQLAKIIDVTTEWWKNVGEDEAMLQILTLLPNGMPGVVCCPFYNGTEAQGQEKFKAFLEIGPIINTCKEVPYEQLNALQNQMAGVGECVYMKGISQQSPDYDSTSKALTHILDFIKLHEATPDPSPKFQPTIIFEYFPSAKLLSVPSTETAFRRDKTSGILIFAKWKPTTTERADLGDREKPHSAIARVWAHQAADILKEGQKGVAETELQGYSNYDSEAVWGEEKNVEHMAPTAFAGNYKRLQEVKKKYDPEGVFNKWFPITPA